MFHSKTRFDGADGPLHTSIKRSPYLLSSQIYITIDHYLPRLLEVQVCLLQHVYWYCIRSLSVFVYTVTFESQLAWMQRVWMRGRVGSLSMISAGI